MTLPRERHDVCTRLAQGYRAWAGPSIVEDRWDFPRFWSEELQPALADLRG